MVRIAMTAAALAAATGGSLPAQETLDPFDKAEELPLPDNGLPDPEADALTVALLFFATVVTSTSSSAATGTR
ncbi:hypothetical protein KUH32_01810 [Thalassococcus sp. CAU 1522]|uniref:Uncharacterized protein n=1 Tax=Thalassococcus arenae TaxID=2851652 RepID=A0ABS6N3Y7_9RHOB|nr:hypothetical protein [Thalassococcus arenae]MBV2358498.1 hypothetical protein [Thalassococcus arenae]